MKPDKIYLSLTLLIILSSYSWISSCTHQPDPSLLPLICYERDIMPVIGPHCTLNECHNGYGESIKLTDYKAILDAVVPGNADASPLYKAIISVRGEGRMPPGQPPLPEELRSKIRVWIEQGADSIPCPDN